MNQITAMTIGGSDPSAGAGIQADLKAFTSIGIHAATILTSLTVQNTLSVKKIIPTNPDIIQNQIETVMEDIPIKYVKTGLLYKPEIANIVAAATKEYHWNLIVDPVITATSGDSLAKSNLKDEIKKTLLPLSTIITPNIPEAETLTQTSINSINDMKHAAKIVHDMGVKNVVIKGGHLQGKKAYDILYDGKQFTILSFPKILNKKAHGSGCAFSALITGFLAQGNTLKSSFLNAKAVLWQMIKNGYSIGKGADVLQITSKSVPKIPYNLSTTAHVETWIELSNVLSKISNKLPLSFTAEVGCNIGYSLPNAKKPEDICAINGRIIRSLNKPRQCGQLHFGASKHIASIILAAKKTYPKIRCAMNIKYSKETLNLCKETSYKIASFDREKEPKNISSTMEWGTQNALLKTKKCPDFIYDTGGIGKEPMIRILGYNPKNVYTKLIKIIDLKKQR